jgi:hypothetical protein
VVLLRGYYFIGADQSVQFMERLLSTSKGKLVVLKIEIIHAMGMYIIDEIIWVCFDLS